MWKYGVTHLSLESDISGKCRGGGRVDRVMVGTVCEGKGN